MFGIILVMQTSTKFIIAVIIIAIIGYFAFNYRSTPEGDVQQAAVSDTDTATTTAPANSSPISASAERLSASSFDMTFTGYGPAGKTETGTFATKSFTYASLDVAGRPQGGVMTLDTRTVSTGKAGLDKHLCNDDFFMCEKFPEATFVISSFEQVPGTSYPITGELTFMGVTKTVSFDANMVEGKYVGEFLLDITPFNFKYVGVDPQVLIKFSLGL